MPTTFFLVRAVVAPHLRVKFDAWYSADHLPWAIRIFKCDKAWRFWSETEPGVHYAVYRFADKGYCDAALGSDEFKDLVADFTRTWPEGVTRTRDIVTLVEERGPAPSKDDKSAKDVPWFRRFRPDGRMEPHATRGDNGEILILDDDWAASFKDGAWRKGILFLHDHIAEFTPVQDRDEIYRLVGEARAALGAKGLEKQARRGSRAKEKRFALEDRTGHRSEYRKPDGLRLKRRLGAKRPSKRRER